MARLYEARLGRVRVSYEILEETLALPDGTTIRRITHDEIYNRTCELVVHSPSLPIVGNGAQIPIVDYTVTRFEGEFQIASLEPVDR